MFKDHPSFPFFLVLWLMISFCRYPALSQKKYVFEQPEMGSPFIISIHGDDSSAVAAAANAAFRKIDTLNTLFSDYIGSSELSRLSATAGSGKYISVSPCLMDILQRSLQASRYSNGSFDITVGPVVKIWRKARKEKIFPERDMLQKAMQAVGYKYIHLDSLHRAAWLERPGMQLDLGGIAKGYAAQAALQVIREAGFPAAMVDAGGDLMTGAAPPGRTGWRIGINLPEEQEELMPKLLLLQNRAVATSGDVYQYLEFNGRRYSHIVDPKTGLGVTLQRNVTVIARDGATADWLATACSILPLHKAFRLIKKFPDAGLLITERKKETLFLKMSKGFKNYLEK